MQEMIILGQIPGTNIQITFYEWLVVVLSITATIYLTYRLTNNFQKIRLYFNIAVLLFFEKHLKNHHLKA